MTPPKLTKGMKDALAAIASGQGKFHKIVAGKIEAAGLAVARPTMFNMLVGCNIRFASDWLLTEAGAAAIGMEAR